MGGLKRRNLQFGRRATRLRDRTSRKIHARKRFIRMGHSEKIKLMSRNDVLPRTRNRCVGDNRKGDLLKQSMASLPDMASAVY